MRPRSSAGVVLAACVFLLPACHREAPETSAKFRPGGVRGSGPGISAVDSGVYWKSDWARSQNCGHAP